MKTQLITTNNTKLFLIPKESNYILKGHPIALIKKDFDVWEFVLAENSGRVIKISDNAIAIDEKQSDGTSYKPLNLVLDLDMTMLHTTHDRVKFESFKNKQNVFKFSVSLVNELDKKHFTILRPFAKEFVESMWPFYRLSIYTIGNAEYAQKCASFLGYRFFEDRKFSSFSLGKDTKSLDDISGAVEKNTLIVDDSPWRWEKNPFIFQIHRYRFWDENDVNEKFSIKTNSFHTETVPLEFTEKGLNDIVLKSYSEILKGIFGAYVILRENPIGLEVIFEAVKKSVFKNCIFYFLSGDAQCKSLVLELGGECRDQYDLTITHVIGKTDVYENNKVFSLYWFFESVVHLKKASSVSKELHSKNYGGETYEVVGYSKIICRILEYIK